MVDGSASRALQQPLHEVTADAAQFVVLGETLEYSTSQPHQLIDITEDVRGVVERAGVAFGQVAVCSTHTTAAIIINENEPLLLNDLARVLSRLAPADDYYEHNDFSIRTVNMTEDECANGHAHCQHVLLGTSETLPVHEGEIQLGQWQRIFLVELDHARPRTIFVQVLGTSAGG